MNIATITKCHNCALMRQVEGRGICLLTGNNIINQSDLICPGGFWDDPPREDWSVDKFQPLFDFPGFRVPSNWTQWKGVQQLYHDRMLYAATKDIPTYEKPNGSDRGIVMCGLGGYFASAYVSIKMTRHVGDNDPIELWGLPHEQLQPWQAKALEGLGVTVRFPRDDFRFADRPGWQLKAYALINSSFRDHIRYSDADSYPTWNTSIYWDSRQYKDYGAIYFPDAVAAMGHHLLPSTWLIFGMKPRLEPDIESGQMYVNKARHWRVLWLSNWMNQHSDYYYNVSPKDAYGDKYTFALAHRFLDADFALMKDLTYRNPCFLHKAPNGAIGHVHRVNGKMTLEDYENYFVTVQRHPRHRRNNGIPMEDVAWGFLDELRDIAKSNGYVPPPRPKTTVFVQKKNDDLNYKVPIKIYGLQRTGTNLVSWLIHHNFMADTLDEKTTGWKHGKFVAASDDARFILCVRHPLSHLTSFYRYCTRNPGDPTIPTQFHEGMTFEQFLTSPCYEFASPIKRWIEMYRHWLNALPEDRRLIVCQEDQVNEQTETLDKIHDHLHLTPTVDHWETSLRYIDVDEKELNQFPSPPDFSAYTSEMLTKIDTIIPPDLMNKLGYDVPAKEMTISDMVKGMIGFMKSSMHIDRADDVTIARRKAICSACEHRRINMGNEICGLCNCILTRKTSIASEMCPDHPPRW